MRKVAVLAVLPMVVCGVKKFTAQDCDAVMGKDRDEVLALYGQPGGVSKSSDGTEVYTYMRTNILVVYLKNGKVVRCSLN